MRLRFHKNSCAELGMRQACAHWLSKCPCEERTRAPSSKRLSQEQMLGDYTAKAAKLNTAMAERRIMSIQGGLDERRPTHLLLLPQRQVRPPRDRGAPGSKRVAVGSDPCRRVALG